MLIGQSQGIGGVVNIRDVEIVTVLDINNLAFGERCGINHESGSGCMRNREVLVQGGKNAGAADSLRPGRADWSWATLWSRRPAHISRTDHGPRTDHRPNRSIGGVARVDQIDYVRVSRGADDRESSGTRDKDQEPANHP